MDLLLIGLAGAAGAVAFALYFFLGSFAFGAGFEPTSRGTVRSMLRLAEVGPSDTVVDLGAGTGAIVFRAAQEFGSRAVAIEREPVRYTFLRARRRWSRYRDQISVRREDLFRASLSSATVVTLFLWPSTMDRLRPRLETELCPGARVVSHYHRIGGWVPVRRDEARRVYLYRVPESIPSALRAGGR